MPEMDLADAYPDRVPEAAAGFPSAPQFGFADLVELGRRHVEDGPYYSPQVLLVLFGEDKSISDSKLGQPLP